MNEKKNISGVLVVILTLVFLAVLVDWCNFCKIEIPLPSLFLDKLGSARNGMVMRFLFVALFGLFIWLIPSRVRVKDETTKNILLITMLILGLIIIVGCIGIEIYDLIIFPIIFIAYMVVSVYAISSMRKTRLSNENIFGISCVCKSNDFYFEFNTDQGLLRIHKPQQNIYIEGGPGSGKSDTFIKSIIEQCAKRNYAGFIYDWEGDPLKKGSPILSKIAYGSIEYYKKHGCCRLNFGFINFTDMTRTVRVNVLSQKYVTKGNESLFIRNIATTLLKNLETSWKEKTDFWANNAINFVYSVAYKCFKERDKKINTLPHVIAICLHDSDAVFKWLSEDSEICLNMSSMITAWKMGVAPQTAGAVSSAQTPLVTLNNKNIFWVLSANADEEFDLNITRKDKPTLLCVGNSPDLKDAVSPAISCIGSIIMSQMNQPDKENSVFLIDELPTINLQGLETFSSTARKHYVATIPTVQDFAQAERDLGQKSATILKSNCGNQFFGMTGNNMVAKEVQDLLGDIDKISESFTTQNDSGSGSESESLKKEKVLNSRDIAGQKIGHFVGKIADGEPPFCYAQFDREIGISAEIPPFSLVVATGDQEKDVQVMDAIVEAHYNRIINEAKELLKPYMIK